MGIVEKISDIENEIKRTQKNKGNVDKYFLSAVKKVTMI